MVSASEASQLQVQAWVLGSRLDLRGLAEEKLVAHGPNTYELGPGRYLAAFRYGVVVFFGLSEREQAERIEALAPHVASPLPEPEEEELEIRVRADGREGLDADGVLALRCLGVERLQVVAHILAKSTVLTHYEERVAEAFGRVESHAQEVDSGPSRRRSQQLLREIRDALAIQVQTVGRVEMTEKPEILWDAPDLDRLYEYLVVEFELRERDSALSRKLSLISESASTSLEMIHTRQGLRLEWYIVILIAFEIVLIIWDILRP